MSKAISHLKNSLTLLANRSEHNVSLKCSAKGEILTNISVLLVPPIDMILASGYIVCRKNTYQASFEEDRSIWNCDRVHVHCFLFCCCCSRHE